MIFLFNLPLIYPIFKKSPVKDLGPREFNEWFTGFVDAEGNFQVYFDRTYLRIKFRITLHIDDTEVLYTIQKRLGIGTVRQQKISSVFEISKLEDINSVLIPIFESSVLRTTKYLDYLDFKQASLLLTSLSTTRLDYKDSSWARDLIIQMNSGRELYDSSLIPNTPITSF